MNEVLLFLLKNRVSPNQYYLMLCYKQGVSPILINEAIEKRILQNDGWVLTNNTLSDKAHKLLEEVESMIQLKKKKTKKEILGEDASRWVQTYRELFPPGKLPSGAPSRINEKDLTDRFTWFFSQFPQYNWETVIAATRLYIAEFEPKGYQGMRNSAYFIYKQDQYRRVISDLATYCGMIEEGSEIDELPQIKIV